MSTNKEKTSGQRRVVVGISGGVDSTVAAAQLSAEGFDIKAVYIKTWQVPSNNQTDAALKSAMAVAKALGVSLQVIDAQKAFYQQVVEPFLDAYSHGYTPNPCVMCNPLLKFATLLKVADKIDAQWIATGHYARIEHPSNGPSRLFRARNHRQDQAYVLYRLTQAHLSRLRLPLGEIESKAKVREFAQHLDLPSAERRDSQDLCFMRGGDYRDLVRTLRPDYHQPGPILNESGKQIGQHQGLPMYTVGQRSGLGISAPEPLYVLQLIPEQNALIAGPKHRLARKHCHIADTSFTTGSPPATSFRATARIRYRAPIVSVNVDTLDTGRARITFSEPQSGVAPGQSLVLYQREEVIGGGIIDNIN